MADSKSPSHFWLLTTIPQTEVGRLASICGQDLDAGTIGVISLSYDRSQRFGAPPFISNFAGVGYAQQRFPLAATALLPEPFGSSASPHITVAGEWRAPLLPLLHRCCCYRYNAEAYLTVTYNTKRSSLGGLMCPFCL